MRQTPFGVWNLVAGGGCAAPFPAPMRQTPFGVWNPPSPARTSRTARSSNEADAFRRLEYLIYNVLQGRSCKLQ